MKLIFDEDKFINKIVKFYLYNDINNYSLVFDIFFIELIKTTDCKQLLEIYCTKEEIEDAKYRFKDNYVELKLSLVLYQKFINSLIDKKIYCINTLKK